jgi:subtilisin family serine protease
MTRPDPTSYYWLWHLAAMRVIDADYGADAESGAAEQGVRPGPPARIAATRWDEIAALPHGATATASVALIDTGTSRRHPNLAGRIDVARSIDLTSHRHGARYSAPPDGPSDRHETRQAFFADLDLRGLDLTSPGPGMLAPDEHALLQAMVAEIRASFGVERYIAEPEEAVSSHGTACAGLMVGHPALVEGPGPVALDGKVLNPNPNLLPYFGVDPFSSLVSIRTSFEDDAMQFILAFLYANHLDVQAIVLPRGLPDPVRSALSPLDAASPAGTWDSRLRDDLIARLAVPGDAPDPSASQTGYRPQRLWDLLEKVVIAVSKRIPVFCAAGNDGESQVIYPANLAHETNGIVAVGAVTAEGYRSGYSNYGHNLTLVLPSDDYEILNRHQSRLDRADPMIAMHDYRVGSQTEVPYCPLDLVTTDLPGVFGYDRGSAPWSSLTDPARNPGAGGGYYTAFGGTSGASCLAGGLAILAQRARRAAGRPVLSGVEMKAAMAAASSHDTAVLPGRRPLTGDAMNRRGEQTAPKERFFGAGLPDARALIAAMLE